MARASTPSVKPARASTPSGKPARVAVAPLELLADRFRTRVARARRQLGWGLVLLGLVGAALLGRLGTAPTRLSGAALLLAAISALGFALISARRTLADRRRLIAATLAKADPVVGGRALRALSLVERPAPAEASTEPGESPELSQLHFQRMLALVKPASIERWAARVGDRVRLVLLVVLVSAATAFALDPARVLEGLDVLVATGGRAPVPMLWLGSIRVESQPPAYLKLSDRNLFPSGTSHEAAGSVITFRGTPEREGRKLVLLGGEREVPFVSDGSGAVVARWVLERPVELRVAARFGNVVIPEPEGLELKPVADEAPKVELEGAPQTLQLKDVPSLELRYVVRDDYGLREVALVLRAGGREERRSLERLDGEAKEHTGAQALSAREPFLRRSFLPVEVTIEARDNDGVSGAKWGMSQPITLLPPGIGEGEALRHAALKAARDVLVKAYARALQSAAAVKKDAPLPSAEALRKEQAETVSAALAALRSFADGTYAGMSVAKPIKTFLLGQSRALERPAPTRETFLRRLEDVLLAVDAAQRATGDQDAATVAKRLGDVAEEVADGCKLGLDSEKHAAAKRRLGAAVPVLERGVGQLLTLSSLGADLGSVAAGETRRIQRGLSAGSYRDAELAARHLAARLRRPKPSFSSADSGGVEGGGQGGRRGSTQPGEASQAHQQFQELMRELGQLSAEHAGEIGSVEGTLEQAEQAEQADQDPELSKEAKERAEALRRALEDLPDYAAGQTPAEQAAALAREHGRAMAESLSRLALKDAKQSATNARQQLRGARSGSSVSPEALSRAEQEVEKQLAWVEDLLQKAQERADKRAKQALEGSGKREQELAERAQNLSGRGSHGEAALPGEVADALDRAEGLMRDAARELAAGHGERALQLQREAQRWLDQQDDEDSGDSEREEAAPPSEPKRRPPHDPTAKDDKGNADVGGGEVPGRDRNQRAEAFGKRVLQGLSKDQGGRLGPAVKRYAEGLLQ